VIDRLRQSSGLSGPPHACCRCRSDPPHYQRGARPCRMRRVAVNAERLFCIRRTQSGQEQLAVPLMTVNDRTRLDSRPLTMNELVCVHCRVRH
jgi:hypothetical protein